MNSAECNSIELTYYQRNRDLILNRAKDYYENDKERLREQARDKYRNLSKEEKKPRLKKNIKKIIARQKSLNIIMNKIVFNCGLIGYAVNLVIHITINKIVFKLWFDSVYYLSVHY